MGLPITVVKVFKIIGKVCFFPANGRKWGASGHRIPLTPKFRPFTLKKDILKYNYARIQKDGRLSMSSSCDFVFKWEETA